MFPSRRATLGGDVFRDEFSVSFDGTDEFINTTLPPSTFHGDFSVVAWVKRTTSTSRQTIICSRDADKDQALFEVAPSTAVSNNKLQFRASDGTDRYTTGSTEINTESGWTHVAYTNNNGVRQRVYVNGKVNGSSTHDFTLNLSANVFIGSNTGSSQFWNGSISEIAIYNKALSKSEMKTIYNGREPYNHKEGVCANNLIAWYRMGDGALDRFGITGDTNFQNGVITDVLNAKLGNNLVTNGDFSNWTGDNPDNWTVNNETSDNTISQSGNAVRMVFTTGDFLDMTQSILTVDKIYKVTIDCTAFDSGTGFRIQSGNDSANRAVNILSSSGLGTYVGYLKASHSNLRIIRNGAIDVTFTNVTCREVLNNTGIVRNMIPTNITGNTP